MRGLPRQQGLAKGLLTHWAQQAWSLGPTILLGGP